MSQAYLYKSHGNHEDKQWEPLQLVQTSTQQQDGEQSSCENLELVGHLEDGRNVWNNSSCVYG